MATRDEIRTQIFSSSKNKKKVVKFYDAEVEIRQPTLGMIMQFQAVDGTDTKKDALVQMMIELCYIPGTSERIFEEADYDTLLGLPFDEDLQSFVDEMNALMGITPEQAEGNSKGDLSGTSS